MKDYKNEQVSIKLLKEDLFQLMNSNENMSLELVKFSYDTRFDFLFDDQQLSDIEFKKNYCRALEEIKLVWLTALEQATKEGNFEEFLSDLSYLQLLEILKYCREKLEKFKFYNVKQKKLLYKQILEIAILIVENHSTYENISYDDDCKQADIAINKYFIPTYKKMSSSENLKKKLVH